jgi:excisionase family DNA binding protein
MLKVAPEPNATVQLRTIPSADRGFALHVARIAERQIFSTPHALEERLRRLYPAARVRSRDLSGEEPCWYVFRDGHWTGWPVAAWWVDPNLPRLGLSRSGEIVRASRAAADLVDLRSRELIGRHVRSILTADPEDVGALLQAVASAGEWNALVRVRSSDGRRRICEAHAETTDEGMALVLKPRADRAGAGSAQPGERHDDGSGGGAGPDRAGRVLTIAEAARITGRNPELLRRWCAGGRLRARRMGRDWIIDRSELQQIEGMPRRRVSDDRTRIQIDDLGILSPPLRTEDCLGDRERVRVVVPGVEDSALVATDRRIFMARDGVMVTDPESGEPAGWPLSGLRRVQFDSASGTGALVMTPVDPDRRALVVVLARPHLARAEAAADALRTLLLDGRRGRPRGSPPH